jgi:hypothetical protein
MLKGNKGEWGELYAFCYLLKSGELHAADKDLNALESIYFPIIRIIREENSGTVYNYEPGEKIKIYLGDTFVKEINSVELDEIVSTMYREIPSGSRAFEIREVEAFFEKIYCGKLKANSTQKKDIVIQLHDIHTGVSPVCGFSIKSYLGANPTLINPGRNTNFVYTINGCNDEIMNRANSIATRTKIIDKMRFLVDSGCCFVPNDHLESPRFKENLEFIDTGMPKFLSLAVLYSYQYRINRSQEVVNKMKELNPLNYSNLSMYEYKYKKLLCACALGMTPEKDWEGDEDANGGYIVVKRDGTVVCYHIYNRGDFEQYLLDYTYFDRPSTSRYEYMNIYREGNEYRIKLNLQVRFN